MKRAHFALALGTGLLAMAIATVAMAAADQQALHFPVEVHPDHSIVTFVSPGGDRGDDSAQAASARLLALPPGATRVEARVLAGPAGLAPRARLLPGSLRGLSVALLELEAPPAETARVALYHDGDWVASAESRLRQRSRGFDAVFGAAGPAGGDRAAGESANGAYVIVTTEALSGAVAPLIDWKRRKGLEVVMATTAETGATREEIRAWLRAAYNSWDTPPEYLLIVGDVEDVPSWFFSGNVTDHPYTLMDEDDWLPDLMMGRLSVEDEYQAQTVVNKSIAYERSPYFGGERDWFEHYLLVAADYASETPTVTVTFCGEQLETLGFTNGFFLPPPFDVTDPWWADLLGVFSTPRHPTGGITNAVDAIPIITANVDAGVSLLAYRGWAQFVDGWFQPEFLSESIPFIDNGAMTPVVMSFVCLNGDFSYANRPCFGEHWIRQGTPNTSKGAVAFIGNGEHWSHTRYNDAMAIAFYERIVDPAITTLGQLYVAGRTNFVGYFPHEMDFATHGEESTEFYMHIYNLLGDPELNFWKDTPTTLTVGHEAVLPAGGNSLEVTVTDDATAGPLAGARVGVVQGDQLLGCAWAGETGTAHVSFAMPTTGDANLAVTVTHPDRVPYEGEIVLDDSNAFCAAQDYELTEIEGNGDGLAGPGETVSLLLTVANGGGTDATGVAAQLDHAPPYFNVTQGEASVPNVPAGGSATAEGAFELMIAGETPDGLRAALPLTVTHDGSAGDPSDLVLEVFGPALVATGHAIDGDGYADPGETVSLTVTVRNDGRASSGGAVSGRLIFSDPAQGTLVNPTCVFGALAPGEEVDNGGEPFVFDLAGDLVPGTQVSFRLLLTVDEGAAQESSVGLLVGRMSPGLPVGPDDYGYHAYDSADLFFAQRPAYDWVELSTLFGGPGEKIEYNYDNNQWVGFLELPSPFTFRYYGQDVDSVRVCDNGWVSFDTDDDFDFYNWTIPNAHGNHSVVAPFWDNFNPAPAESIPGDSFKDGVYHYYDEEGGAFIVEWSRMRHYRQEISELQTFELILLDPAVHPTASGDGEIVFQYRQVNNADYLRGYATVGIEDQSETVGLQLSYSGLNAAGMAPLTPGLAVKLTTEPPVFVPFRLDDFAAEPGESGGLKLSWSTSDERPVLGWRLSRLEDGREVELNADLPASARSYIDDAVDPAVDHEYRLVAEHPYGQESLLGPFHSLGGEAGASRLALAQSLPNPMHESARIDYVLPAAGHLSLRIYDTAGRLVRTLHDGPAAAGPGSALWNGLGDEGRTAATGVYFYRLEAASEVLTRKLMLIR